MQGPVQVPRRAGREAHRLLVVRSALPSFSTTRVTAVLVEREGLQRVELDSGRRAYVLTQLIGAVAVGDRVLVNTTAVELGLGTGGWDVVHWNLERDTWSEPGPGHIMKLRYTSLQVDTGAAEESHQYDDGRSGQGPIPVVALLLHSQLAAVAAAYKHVAPDRRLVYVMTDGAALPIALSDLVHDLRRCGLIDATVTAGQSFGGDHEAVSLSSGLAVARDVAGADAIVVGSGPGVVGTDTHLGFSGMEVVHIVAAATILGETPFIAARYSDADERPRHRGISHHLHSVLDGIDSLGELSIKVTVAVPTGVAYPRLEARTAEVDVPDVAALLAEAGVEVTTMGRTPAEDPGFFTWAGAAGVAAALASVTRS